MEVWELLIIPILIFVTWFYTATTVRSRFPTLRSKAIVLLIAHPDDEAMFFAPTVIGLTQPELGNHLKILCLSNGNADGLGAVRAREIKASALELGLRSADDVLVLDDPAFPDSMQQSWSADAIVSLLNTHFVVDRSGGNSTRSKTRRQDAAAAVTTPPSTTSTSIDVLVTFDAGGISGHINHRSLYHGAVAWLRDLNRAGRSSAVQLYTLPSINIARKYAGLLDMPATLAGGWLRSMRARTRDFPERPVFVNDIGAYLRARRAMTTAHQSQMVWFRWGWITLGRYMYVNDLQRVHV